MAGSQFNLQAHVLLPCALLSLLAASSTYPQTVATPGDTHCRPVRDSVYECNREAFQRRLQHARTMRVDTDRLDLYAAGELRRIAPNLGLTAVSGEQKPDLIFDLSAVDHSGRIDFGPADIPLATLSVYDPAKGSGRRSLIWVETFIGQQDRPWPSVVTGLLQQFQDHALSH